METLFQNISNAFNLLKEQIVTFSVKDAFDIVIVAVLLYILIRFFAERRAGKLVFGIVVLVVLRIIGGIVGFSALNFIFDIVFQAGLVAIVIVFQPELRAGLEKIGGESLKGVKTITSRQNEFSTDMEEVISTVIESTYKMGSEKRGALIAIERNDNVEHLVTNQATVLDADLNEKLLMAIFFKNNELHDGAIIIRDGKIHAATCYFPMPETKHKKTELGTRHAAALGVCEQSDAVVIVVSEQTGHVSLAVDKKLELNLTKTQMYDKLNNLLLPKSRKPAKLTSRRK